MKKFLVLNQNFQPLNPYQYSFKVTNSDVETDPRTGAVVPSNMLLEEDEAKAFAEHMAPMMINQPVYIFEMKCSAKAVPPVKWTDTDGKVL